MVSTITDTVAKKTKKKLCLPTQINCANKQSIYKLNENNFKNSVGNTHLFKPKAL